MAENDGRYGFGVTLTDESVKRVAEEVKKEFQGISQSAAQEGAKMESSFRKIGTALGVGFSLKAAADFGKQIVKVRGEIESLEVSFRTLLGSEQKATALMTDIRKFAATTPMQLNDLASGAQTLLGFNIEAEKVMPTLKALGDISMGDSQKFQSITLAFAQMSSTGKLMGQDLLQMINAGFNPLVQIAERTGKSVAELKEEMSQGKISVEMVTQAFMDATSEGGKFYNMLEKQSKGIQGSLSNLKGAFDDMLNDIGENSDGVITKSVQGLTKLVQNYETVGKVIGTLVATYGSYKAAVMAYNVIATISNGLTAGLTAKEIIHAYTLGVVTKAQKLLNATMLANPYVLCATLLISLAAAIAITADRTSEAERQQKAYNDILEENNKKYEEVTGKIEKFIGIIKDETQTLYDRNDAYKEFMKLFPEYFKQFEGNFAEAKKAADELMNDEAKRHEAELNERIAAAKKQMERYEKLWQDYEYALINGKPGEATNNDLLDNFLREHENEAEEHGYNGGFLNFHQDSNIIKYLKDYRAQTKKVYEDMVRDKEEAEKELVKQKQHEEWLKLPREDRIKGTTKVIKQLEGEVENLQKKMEGAGMMEQKYYSLLLKRYQMQLRKFRELKDEAESEPDFASLKKATQNAYNAMQRAQKLYKSSPTKANEEAYDKAKEDFETKDKQYEKATGKKYSDQLEDAKDRAKEQKELNNALKKEQEEYAKWLKQQSVEAEFEARQAGIDAMKEGLDKTIAQINLEYDRQKATIEEREEEMVEKLRDLKEAEWNAQNPTKKKNGEKFDRSTVTAADLTQEQQDQLTAYTEQALAERNRLEREAMDEMTGAKKTYLAQQAEMERQYLEARKLLVEKGATEDDLALFDRTYQANQKALFNEMLGDAMTYFQKREKIEQDYAKRRESLYEEGTITRDENGRVTGGTLKQGVSQSNAMELDRQERDDLMAIDEQFAERSAAFRRWASELGESTVKELRTMLETAKKALETLSKNPDADPQRLAEARAQVALLEREIEDAALTPGEEDIEQWIKYGDQIGEVGSAISDLGDQMEGTTGKVVKLIGTMLTSASTVIKRIGDLSKATMKGIEGTAQTTSAVAQAVSSSVAILAIISAIYTVITNLRDAVDGWGEDWQWLSDYLHNMTDNLTLQSLLTLGLSTLWDNTTAKARKHDEVLEGINDSIDDIGEQYDVLDKQSQQTWGASNAEIRRQQIELKKAQIELLKTAIAEEKAQKKPDNDKIKEWEKQINAINKDIDDLGESAVDAIYGEDIKSAIENFGDALIEAWEGGKSASQSANDYMRNMIKKTVTQAILDYTQASQKIEAIRAKLKEYLENDGIIDENEKADLEGMAQRLMEEVEDEFEWAQSLFDESSRNASRRGIATASQESVDELNGRMTAVQGHTFNISENSNVIRSTIEAIYGCVQRIEYNTERLHSIKSSIDDIQIHGVRIRQ